MSPCESTLMVRPEHLNHHGFLFGGRLLEWLDEQAYIAAISKVSPKVNLVTVAIDRVSFRHQVREGALLRFRSQFVHVGTTSVTLRTEVFHVPEMKSIFRAYVTFVALDENGQPMPVKEQMLEPYTPTTADEKRRWQEVESARKARKQKDP